MEGLVVKQPSIKDLTNNILRSIITKAIILKNSFCQRFGLDIEGRVKICLEHGDLECPLALTILLNINDSTHFEGLVPTPLPKKNC
jgi:hypothetical protein